jgi:xanthine dehydrogenase accessory factor
MDWLAALNTLHNTSGSQAVPAVLVTVATVEGSSPRETGAKMVVTQVAQFDTIGGGHLELRACEIAREMLASRGSSASPHVSSARRIERFPLGPSLGQCCGGVVHLAFELIEPASAGLFRTIAAHCRERGDNWRLVPLDGEQPSVLLDARGQLLAGDTPAPLEFDLTQPCHVLKDDDGKRWLVDPCRAWRQHLVLFGAGHVGAAIVRAMADLPCHVTWVDERDDMFPAIVPANVKIEATDTPEAVVDEAPHGASYLVMTHSHALDQRLSEAILKRNDALWFGLIGSKTKRMQFEHRLVDRGIPRERLKDMTCPVGIPGITGKAPAVIAASVCAQLLQVWEDAERNAEARASRLCESIQQ